MFPTDIFYLSVDVSIFYNTTLLLMWLLHANPFSDYESHLKTYNSMEHRLCSIFNIAVSK